MWDFNKAVVALIAGLVLPGLTGIDPWLANLWHMGPEVMAGIVAALAWLVPNGRPVWQMWKK